MWGGARTQAQELAAFPLARSVEQEEGEGEEEEGM